MSNRTGWVDIARGTGIILVVFGHVWRGVNEAGLIPEESIFRAIDAAIYVFHMPLFFLLSGLFFEKTVLRSGTLRSLLDRTEALLYPLVLWSWITAAFLLLAGSLTNRPPISALDALTYPFPPKDIFWFLWALFVIQSGMSLIVRSKIVYLAAVFAVSILVLVAFGMDPFPNLLKRVVANLPFFVLGILVARLGMLSFRVGSSAGPIALLAFSACLLWAASNPSLIETAPAYLAGLVATLAFCTVAAWAFAALPTGASTPLAALGIASIAVYVSHIMPLAAVRIGLLKAGVTSLPLHLVVGTFAGVLPAAVAYYALRKWRLLRWFGLGRNAPRVTSPAPSHTKSSDQLVGQGLDP